MTTAPPPLDQIDVTDGGAFAAHGYPWAAWAQLRREAPVYWYERPYVQPHWAITKYDDIQRISRDPGRFSSQTQLFVGNNGPPAPEAEGQAPQPEPAADGGAREQIELFINMDPPRHSQYRGLVNRSFTPRGLRVIEARIDEIAADVIDRAAAHLVDQTVGGASGRARIEFVDQVAAQLPLAAICELLGVAREDWQQMFRLSNEMTGAGDPEYQQGRSAAETAARAGEQLIQSFALLAEVKRSRPANDLMTTLVQAELDGRPLSMQEIIAYGFLLIIAGNETTRNATSAGLLSLIEHPEQTARLRAQPELLNSAVEEILRWTSPVTHMARLVTEEVEIRGQRIAPGETIVMWYPSANRDEDVFEEPERFDIARDPNEHLAFGGFGEHFCLGANLARLELRSIFRHLLARMDEIELDGGYERLRSGIVGGIKRMPVSFNVR